MKDVYLPEAFSANWIKYTGRSVALYYGIRPTKQQQVQVLIPDITNVRVNICVQRTIMAHRQCGLHGKSAVANGPILADFIHFDRMGCILGKGTCYRVVILNSRHVKLSAFQILTILSVNNSANDLAKL